MVIFKLAQAQTFVRQNWKRLSLLCTVLILLAVPQLLWKQYGYFVGGDDSLLQYVYPEEMITHFAQNIATNNTLSGPKEYIERLHMLPLLHLISLVNRVTGLSNSLYLFVGFILAGSFLSFFFFLEEVQENLRNSMFFEKFFVSLLYTLGVHHYLSVMNYKLVVMYIVFLVPFVLFLFTRALLKNRPLLLIPAALVTSLFSVVLVGIPWFFGYLIALSSVLSFLFIKFPKRFITFAVGLVSLILTMNFYWIFHFVYAIVSNSAETNGYSGILTAEFRQRNIDAILSVTTGNSLFDALLGFFHPNLQKNFNWPTYSIYENWHVNFIIINIIVLVSVVFVALLYKRRKTLEIFPFAVLGWLVTVYFFTANMMGTLGLRFFLKLNEQIPGFSMFRNNYDKFASGMAFSLAFLLFAVSIEMKTNERIPLLVKKSWLAVLAIFVVVTVAPVVQGQYERDIFITTEKTRASVESLDPRFLDFASQLEPIKNKTVLWMPLSKASYVTVTDAQNPDYVFAGISPLVYLSNVYDYAGVLSFRTRESTRIATAIETQDSQAFGNILKELGITHIIVNNTLTDDMKKSYVYGEQFLAKQNQEFMHEFIGERLLSVDDAYVLYKVKEPYYQEEFYFPEHCKVTQFEMIGREEYRVQFRREEGSSAESCTLHFKQSFHRLWVLRYDDVEKNSTMTDTFQNSWEVDSKLTEVTVIFKPRAYVTPLMIFSGSVAALSALYWIKGLRRHD